ncbi:hypothetical protein FG743_024065 [Salmonella enterica subsp. enterica serovar Hadar]|uniref:hypothetical protein n=1 Tax=Salmonella enterica TaxID=28901 RepID=UPI00117B1CD8|nr:hypothetical protein [Salmonella enterica]TRF72762.1 hypothetical protein FG743_024065 [Salmonella enterica subsp. enterica serovar Hadar]
MGKNVSGAFLVVWERRKRKDEQAAATAITDCSTAKKSKNVSGAFLAVWPLADRTVPDTAEYVLNVVSGSLPRNDTDETREDAHGKTLTPFYALCGVRDSTSNLQKTHFSAIAHQNYKKSSLQQTPQEH